MKHVLLLSLCLSWLLAGSVSAQNEAKGTLYGRLDGSEAKLALEITIERGWHLYHGPTVEDMSPDGAVGKPTSISLRGDGFEWGAFEFPEPDEVEQPSFEEGEPPTHIRQHHGTIVIRVSGKAKAGASLDSIEADVTGLTCQDDGVCVPYGETVKVAGPGADKLFASSTAPKPSGEIPQAAKPQVSGGKNEAKGALYGRLNGSEAKLALQISIDRGWHLYHGPTVEDMSPDGAVGKPTKIELRGDGFEWGAFEFPKPDEVEQPSFEEGEPPKKIRQHHGTIVIRVSGKAKAGASLDSIEADLTGQTCQDGEGGVCVDYAETLKIAGPGADALFVAATAPVVTPAPGRGGETPPPTNTVPPEEEDEGLWLFLLSAVGWGLFTLLMPCTYPMIPITISYFTKQAAQRQTGTLGLSLAYGVGIVLVFVLIGVAIGPLIIPFATHPVTNLVIGGFFLLFALALFGLVNLQPPAFLLSAAGKASSQGGYAGVFLMGATLVVTSFTCTAPFVGTLLSTGATSGGIGTVALGMGVFGATMAIPFVFLSMVPQRVKALPRSGEWMHVLKVTLGFVEIAAALKFISNVDLVWGWAFLSRELFLVLWMGIFLVAAIYLFGLIRLKDEGATEISPGRMVAGLVFALFGLYCGYGSLGNSMDPIMTAIIPNYSGRIASAGGGGKTSATAHTIIKDDYEGALERAGAEGKLLLVNFTGFT